MHEEEDHEEWKPQASFDDMADANAFCHRVAQALSSTEHVAAWAALAAEMDPQACDARVATSWIRIRRPTDRLLWALHRMNRVQGKEDEWQLILSSPIFAHPWVMYAWSNSAVGMLGRLLGDEGEYMAWLLLPARP